MSHLIKIYAVFCLQIQLFSSLVLKELRAVDVVILKAADDAFLWDPSQSIGESRLL